MTLTEEHRTQIHVVKNPLRLLSDENESACTLPNVIVFSQLIPDALNW